MESNISLKTKKAMAKDEVSLLLDLLESKPIIISKETNASSNKLKEDAWNCITDHYNSRNGQFPRGKDQLKAKWDNLKKAARKRCQRIRLNNLKTGGGKPDFIPPDEILERVAGLLGSTCTGFDVPFGGDGVGYTEVALSDGGGTISDGNLSPAIEPVDVVFEYTTPETSDFPLSITPISEAKKRKAEKPRSLYGMSNMSIELQNKGKKKRSNDEDGKRAMHLAIQNYYEAKTAKVRLEMELLQQELAKKTSEASVL